MAEACVLNGLSVIFATLMSMFPWLHHCVLLALADATPTEFPVHKQPHTGKDTIQ